MHMLVQQVLQISQRQRKLDAEHIVKRMFPGLVLKYQIGERFSFGHAS